VPEYLAPGVYVEETSFRAKSIEGVSTSTTAFVGPTRKGPIGDTPEIITSFGDFQRIYGGLDNLTSGLNYVAQAVRSYFDNGGARLYVSRAFLAAAGDSGLAASALVVNGAAAADQARFVARFPGAAGNGRLVLRQADAPATVRSMGTAVEGTLLRVGGTTPTFFVKRGAAYLDSGGTALNLAGLAPTAAPAGGADFLTLSIIAEDADGNTKNFDEAGFDRGHPRWIGHVLAATPSRRVDALENLYALQIGDNVTAFALRSGLFPAGDEQTVSLTGGADGIEPTQAAYEAALGPVATLEDVSIVAAPGHSALTDFQGIQGALISHCERRRAYRIAVLDTPPGQAISGAREVRSRIDSTYAALYYPWVVVANPLARPGDDSIPREITLPPSGFVCGIYARTDIDRGVFKAPANEIVRGALRFESDVNFAQQEVLNPIGVNCLRYLSGRGFRLWGARTASSDPEWKYVSVRRYFNYLEASIDRSTQWAVFEPNGERLWANVRETVESFLYGEWRSGALLGGSTKEAFFVRCDRSTMTQNDLDNGRLVCLIGVAVVKPAEFVIFRIGQKTADARN
jgi:phage tail sheath protein FI